MITQANLRSRHYMEVTHIPTGERVGSGCRRSQHQNRQLALAALRSRLWALQNGYGRSDRVVATYDLAEPYPHELRDCRNG